MLTPEEFFDKIARTCSEKEDVICYVCFFEAIKSDRAEILKEIEKIDMPDHTWDMIQVKLKGEMVK